MAYTIERRTPSPEQWMALRQSVGWATFSREVAEQSLKSTLFCVCAFDGDQLIGMGRVLGDGVISFYIGNVMVLPGRQREGVGRAVIGEIMAYVEDHAAPGAIASLFSVRGKEEFYRHFGFHSRPEDGRGCGMSKFF